MLLEKSPFRALFWLATLAVVAPLDCVAHRRHGGGCAVIPLFEMYMSLLCASPESLQRNIEARMGIKSYAVMVLMASSDFLSAQIISSSLALPDIPPRSALLMRPLAVYHSGTLRDSAPYWPRSTPITRNILRNIRRGQLCFYHIHNGAFTDCARCSASTGG